MDPGKLESPTSAMRGADPAVHPAFVEGHKPAWVGQNGVHPHHASALSPGPAKTARAHGTYKPVAETYPDEKERRISILSRMKNILAAGLTSAVLLGMMATQSFSGNPFFMHLFMPMG